LESISSLLDENRILEAENSLKEKLEVTSLTGKTFLDIGSEAACLVWQLGGWALGFTLSISILNR